MSWEGVIHVKIAATRPTAPAVSILKVG